MAKRQHSEAQHSDTKETSGTRGRSNMNKSSSKTSNNRRSAARVAENPEDQMQAAMPSDGAGQRNGRSRTGKSRSSASGDKKTQTRSKTTSPNRTRSAR